MFDLKSPAVMARYTGTGSALFGLALLNGLFTILTLGIYRFWGKTRIRRYIWSSVDLGGNRPEYTGTGLEKFLGFLVAVVVLAIYLGLVQLILFYFGMHFVLEPKSEAQALMQIAVVYISLFAIMPLMIFARYRARRYMMARTRFMGIRFGMDKGAWGYVWRAIAHGALTVVTLGILLPRQTFWLEKYKTDRSWYGDQKFTQDGRWTGLYGAMRHVLIGLALVVLGFVAMVVAGVMAQGSSGEDLSAIAMIGIVLTFIGLLWAAIGYLYYRVHAYRYLMDNTILMGRRIFRAEPRTGRIIGIYILGSIAISLIIGIGMLLFGAIIAAMAAASQATGGAPGPAMFVLIAVLYLCVFIAAGALGLVFLIQPIIAHFAETLTLTDPSIIDEVQQRAYDPAADAGGFADALDVGAAI
ncbi:uncharacterized membrane protein YjgN (DUF898 family) [Defluviimonas denitrificans]|jgi:uncharacterized membrane protein YjgN (DUF898 family)|uniref:Uncharacterized membrane protein YjgN (DUF898 family) n=2 Tax=Albidovulum denitrificans TaxID=404881 RepID=A0A2S8S4A7_9RHOB|nr:uncharacterized membrane protein YjgN (DUF898 family) [Defluviimonas denitrificans]